MERSPAPRDNIKPSCHSFALPWPRRAPAGAPVSAANPPALRLGHFDAVYLSRIQGSGYGIPGTGESPDDAQSAPFKKEPDLGPRKVYRGTLKFGDGPEGLRAVRLGPGGREPLPRFHRNQDLTDDADGVFAPGAGATPCFRSEMIACSTQCSM